MHMCALDCVHVEVLDCFHEYFKIALIKKCDHLLLNVQEEVLRVAGAKARREKERADAAAAVDSTARAALVSSKNQEVKRLRQEQVCVV